MKRAITSRGPSRWKNARKSIQQTAANWIEDAVLDGLLEGKPRCRGFRQGR